MTIWRWEKQSQEHISYADLFGRFEEKTTTFGEEFTHTHLRKRQNQIRQITLRIAPDLVPKPQKIACRREVRIQREPPKSILHATKSRAIWSGENTAGKNV